MIFEGMIYLFFQIWLWLLIAVAVGWFAHRFFGCKCDDTPTETIAPVTPAAQPVAATEAKPMAMMSREEPEPAPKPVISDDWKPMLFTTAPDPVDDLKRIKGIGAVIEKTLNKLGVYQFKQIAEWDDNNCAWVDNSLSFPGRIKREEWVKQAGLLAKGETTEFAKRVDKGDVSYKG